MGIFLLAIAIAAYGYLFAGFWGSLFALMFIVSVIVSPLVQQKP